MGERVKELTLELEGEVVGQMTTLVVASKQEQCVRVPDLERPQVENTLRSANHSYCVASPRSRSNRGRHSRRGTGSGCRRGCRQPRTASSGHTAGLARNPRVVSSRIVRGYLRTLWFCQSRNSVSHLPVMGASTSRRLGSLRRSSPPLEHVSAETRARSNGPWADLLLQNVQRLLLRQSSLAVKVVLEECNVRLCRIRLGPELLVRRGVHGGSLDLWC